MNRLIVAASRAHYGSPFLGAMVSSTAEFAERHYIIYTADHSFPGNPTMSCPDTRDQLYEIAMNAGGDRVVWIDHPQPSIGLVLEQHPEIGMLLECDTDEVPHQDLLSDILRRFEAGELDHRQYRIPMCHHWRSFAYACHDTQWPGRLYVPHAAHQDMAWYERMEPQRYIHHFGYCVPRAHQLYKWMLSIHRPELRPEWFTEIYDCFPERLTDLHPVSPNFWNAEPFPDGDLPAVLVNHPLRYLEVVD